MTTPGPHSNVEDIGTLEIFGIPFSTFTRSIVLGLEELGLGNSIIQHHFEPHSEEIKKRNPLGLLPVLVHRPDALYTSQDNVVVLFESNAIRKYIDDLVFPLAQRKQFKFVSHLTPTLELHDIRSAEKRARVEQWISIASTAIYPSVEFGVVKPRLAMEKNKADEASIQVALEEGVEKAYEKLTILEDMLKETSYKFLTGSEITWADLFLYPPLADLRAIKEVSLRENLMHDSFFL